MMSTITIAPKRIISKANALFTKGDKLFLSTFKYPAILPPSVEEVRAEMVFTASDMVFRPVKIRAITHFDAHINTYPIPQVREYLRMVKNVFLAFSSFRASTAISGNASVTSGYVRKSK